MHLSTEPHPLCKPTDRSPRILVIGAGVIGLTTAWTLLDRGYKVTVLAKDFANDQAIRLTSQISGALWEYPPAVCGHQVDHTSINHTSRWSMISYHVFSQLAKDPVDREGFGIQLRNTAFFFEYPVESNAPQYKKMQDIQKSGVEGFRHDANIVKECGVEPVGKYQDAYEFLSPAIDSDRALKRIEQLVTAKGAIFKTGVIDQELFDIEGELLSEYGAQVLVNATGLGARITAGDPSVYPLRGAVYRIVNDNTKFHRMERALVVSATNAVGLSQFNFIVPRNDNILLVGGFSEPDEKELDITMDHPLMKSMALRAQEFFPPLQNVNFEVHTDPAYRFAQGLRPARHGDVRVERELRMRDGNQPFSRIVHSYGHGGSGWSWSFGSALQVLVLVEEAIGQRIPPQSMYEL
ncbi:hypothetical protein VNI00_012201 [Paramarasmius palmivorus]|uniref:FAD dependent oxidoreductase domain-containing protein n=1 Tax=Paramarasmius palmivorus TaxID=297713 RepID=A0AAW0C7S5_9AGAR